jgi:hypothetical protein
MPQLGRCAISPHFQTGFLCRGVVMLTDTIEREFKEKVSARVRLMAEGVGRYQVFTPFRFDDGDHLSIVLKQDGSRWVLSDEAHTFMRLTYDIDEQDLQRGTRQKIITNALSVFQVEDRDGELLLGVSDGQYGDALYSFIQALLKITDVSYLSRERVHTTFLEDFQTLLKEKAPEDRLTFDWHDVQRDPRGLYKVDCHINGMSRPLFVHALNGDGKTRDATITLQKFEVWGVDFHSLVIFDDQETINRKVLARLSDVCGTQFSSLTGNHARIERFLTETIAIGGGG